MGSAMDGPRHPDARRFIEAGLFDGLATFRELEQRIAALPTEGERGDAFEVFAEAYLVTQAIIQAAEVWPFAATPPVIKRELRLGGADLGVDGIVKSRLGEFQAYQVKFRSARPALTWTELSTFVGLADYVPRRILFTNCDDIAEVLEERRGFYCIRGSDLDRLESGDFAVLLGWLQQRPVPPPKKTPRPDQREATAAICGGLKLGDRATAVMACGTGKTLVQLWSAERLGCRRVLVLVPSLALLRQSLHVWLRETRWPDLSYLAVCSDPTVKPDEDPLIVRQGDLDFPVTTDSETVHRFLAERTDGVQIVFSTYHSAPEVANGCPDDVTFDLAIFDEAHWTAGHETKRFAFALTDDHLAARKRLFMTATPRHYNPQQRDEEGDPQLVYSMDQPQTYGPRVYTLSFAEAARRGIICDYRVLISVVTSAMVTEEMLRRGVVTVQGDRVTARQVANQIALRKAVERVGTGKIITFHASVKSAASFTSPDSEGIRTHLPEFQAYHVNGTMRAAERDGVMQEFRGATKAVMSNARCLTEGVDVPAVDMVAFIAPRRSRVDIVQATGRAMRTAPGKKTGYVLLPLFLEEASGESVEHAVARAEFEEIWTVLQALQEQDEVLADIIRGMREAEGRTGTLDDARFREKVQILGPAVSLVVLRESITTRCVERLAASWDYLFGKLLAFLRRFGHLNVPHAWSEDPHLAAWVRSQRQRRREGHLSADRIRRLDHFGFEWEPRATAWDEMFNTLVQFKERTGDCNVPADLPYDPQLAHWVRSQRQLRREGHLSADRIQRLDAVGFEWGALTTTPPTDRWDEMFARLVQFREHFGHCKVLRRWPEDQHLSNWVMRQRQLKGKGHLAADRIQRLDALGFEWVVRTSQASAVTAKGRVPATNRVPSWDDMLRRLVTFKSRFGHCEVPLGWSEDLQLVQWVNVQRALGKKGRLATERVERLDALGFKWGQGSGRTEDRKRADRVRTQPQIRSMGPLSEERLQRLNHLGVESTPRGAAPRPASWEELFARLGQFKERFGHCNVQWNWPEDPQLYTWVTSQRSRRKSGRLPKDRVQQLDALGFEWDRKSAREEAMFVDNLARLAAFKDRFGHCNVPFGWSDDPQLGFWVTWHRHLRRQGHLSADRIQGLDALGFEWDVPTTQGTPPSIQRSAPTTEGSIPTTSPTVSWDEMFARLVRFKKSFGHCRVPANWPQDPQLPGWLSTQRQLRSIGRLSAERVQRLDALGFEWEPGHDPRREAG